MCSTYLDLGAASYTAGLVAGNGAGHAGAAVGSSMLKQQAHTCLDLGAALDALLEGAGHGLLGMLSRRQMDARLGRGQREGGGVGRVEASGRLVVVGVVVVGVGVGGCVGCLQARCCNASAALGQHHGAGGGIGGMRVINRGELSLWSATRRR